MTFWWVIPGKFPIGVINLWYVEGLSVLTLTVIVLKYVHKFFDTVTFKMESQISHPQISHPLISVTQI